MSPPMSTAGAPPTDVPDRLERAVRVGMVVVGVGVHHGTDSGSTS